MKWPWSREAQIVTQVTADKRSRDRIVLTWKHGSGTVTYTMTTSHEVTAEFTIVQPAIMAVDHAYIANKMADSVTRTVKAKERAALLEQVREHIPERVTAG